ncbi:transporter substrate-binding domain-containing protein [Dasania sp. GY-MA-18]|uniref:Transporter substrate-binding domain-containing protein n=1 Tax=Dasania phycosphaerae TaxID=2950436 RepID=A0A9J6RID0_9GAMM|nr:MULTISPECIES: transporter substrate-binding domain-containing protein [Dasania]MCR8921791.1 transporter substrate-binding domain-containing protein [Dasania sp. GY-MA-18]MCZ0864219.1 transporter substrate-binding domain-containing protein [Dasania phycosphaerae]MCZ0867947.1 transporter substrate-binding domain-containing protein [Dasania phycosphaerae]
MRKQRLPIILLLAYSLMAVGGVADEVTIVSDRWYPFNGIPNAPDPGYMIEMARYGLEQGGHSLNYQIMSWQHSIDLVRQGKKNCIVGAYKSDAPDFIFSDQHHAVDQMAFYTRINEPWRYQHVDSLAQQRLGVINGYAYKNDIDAYIKANRTSDRVIAAKGKYALENNLLALMQGKLDVVLGSRTVITQVLAKQQWQDKLQIAGYANTMSKIYIACSPNNPKSIQYITLINAGIEQLRKTGQLQALLDKYQVADWQHIEAVDN